MNMKPDEDTSSSGSAAPRNMANTRSHRSFRAAQNPPPVSASPSAADAETMDLKSAIEQGVLTTTSTYREFMTFLDLKHDYHSGFKTLLVDYVTEKKHSWEKLFANEVERQICATGFADEFGMQYWGTEENRKKYLLQESLADTDLLTYPERRAEIIQVIMILLQKMAKSKKEASQQGPETSSKRARESTPRKESKRRARSSSRRPINNHGCPSPELGEEPQPGTKKESFNAGKPMLFSPQKNGMGSATSSAGATRGKPVSTTTNGHQGRVQDPFEPSQGSSRPQPGPSSTTSAQDIASSDSFDLLEQKYARVTRFLVTASTQRDVAPVSSAFYRYSSVSRFLSFMADECGFTKWDPTAQLSTEISNAFLPSPSSALSSLVTYASITFKWSGHSIRVRPGKEKDWKEVLRHIHKAWCVEERKRQEEGHDDDYYYGQDDFNISVLLHITG